MPTGFLVAVSCMATTRDGVPSNSHTEIAALYDQRRRHPTADTDVDALPPLLSIEELDQLVGWESAGLDGNAPTVLGKYNGPGCRPKDCELDLKIDGTHKYLLQKDSRVAVMMSCLLAHGRECL